jgi:hypothetical protein
MNVAGPKKIVVLGIASAMPVPGIMWLVGQYLVGLERLGFEVYYVEAHGMAPSPLLAQDGRDMHEAASHFIADMMARLGLKDRWAFHARSKDRYFGLSAEQLRSLYRSAALIINLHGGTRPLPEHSATGRLLYLETDPVGMEVKVHKGKASAIALLEPHFAFFTWGLNYGEPDCLVPLDSRFRFRRTCQPVVMDFWNSKTVRARAFFTTVGNWRQKGAVIYNGETYHWSKDLEFLKFLDLPDRVGTRFELALSRWTRTDDDVALLTRKGWRVRAGFDSPAEVDVYRDYIRSSRGELTVAKDQNVRLRSGWFSDRSACYLAAGRPVVTQDTGFGRALPVGAGLFRFNTMDELVQAVEAIEADYDYHRRAARAIAEEHFRSEKVLADMLREVGV